MAAAALLAAGLLALLLGGSGGGAASGPADAGGAGTGRVERRTLAERLTVDGTIGYAGETAVLARLTGTVTALPAIGDVIRRGERLYALDGEPVPLMYGAVPSYRALAEGVDEGRDIEQLERNLAALGYEPGAVDEEFTYATAAALAEWQEDIGLEASGELELGRVAFLRGPRRVTVLEATLGEAIGGGSGAGGGRNSMVAWDPEAEEGIDEAEEAEAQEERPEPKPQDEDKEKRQPEEESEPEPESDEKEGSAPEPSSVPVLRTSSTRRVVSVELEADQQSIAQRGQKVRVVLPGGAEAPGEVRGLAAVEASAGEGNPGEEVEPGFEATISVTGKHRIPALDGATVSVRFTQQIRKHVLSVPLTALTAIGGERFAVIAVEGGQRRRIVVTPGLGADGYVEVEGKGLRAGMTVETGE